MGMEQNTSQKKHAQYLSYITASATVESPASQSKYTTQSVPGK